MKRSLYTYSIRGYGYSYITPGGKIKFKQNLQECTLFVGKKEGLKYQKKMKAICEEAQLVPVKLCV